MNVPTWAVLLAGYLVLVVLAAYWFCTLARMSHEDDDLDGDCGPDADHWERRKPWRRLFGASP